MQIVLILLMEMIQQQERRVGAGLPWAPTRASGLLFWFWAQPSTSQRPHSNVASAMHSRLLSSVVNRSPFACLLCRWLLTTFSSLMLRKVLKTSCAPDGIAKKCQSCNSHLERLNVFVSTKPGELWQMTLQLFSAHLPGDLLATREVEPCSRLVHSSRIMYVHKHRYVTLLLFLGH